MTTSSDDIISNGTDGPGEASAGSRTSFGRAKSDPAEAETDSGSKGDTSPASQGAGESPSAPADQSPLAGDPTPVSPDPGEVTLTEATELERVVAERDEYLDLARRTQADFENFRKRSSRELVEARGRAIASVVAELLPVVDNLDRALAASEAAGEGGGLIEGVRMVDNDLHATLDRLGVKPIDPSGEPFDPNVHEAIASVPKDGVPPGQIIEVHQRGFRLDEIVVRPARVVVSA